MGKEVNSKEDAKVHWQGIDGKDTAATIDTMSGRNSAVTAAPSSSSSSVAEALSTCETDELAAQCISWSRHRRVEEIEYALTRGVDIDVKDAAGNTMLIVAAQNRSTTVLNTLVDRGADLNIANAKGNTALHYLFAYGFEAEAEWLIAQGADDYAQNLEVHNRCHCSSHLSISYSTSLTSVPLLTYVYPCSLKPIPTMLSRDILVTKWVSSTADELMTISSV